MALPIDGAPGIGDPGNPGGGGGTGDGGGVGATVFALTFDKQQAESILRVLVYASLASPDDLQVIGYVTIGGTVRQVTPVNLVLDNQQSNAQAPITMPAFVSGLPIGAHDVVFSLRNREPDGALTVRAGAYIEITEIKRAAL